MTPSSQSESYFDMSFYIFLFYLILTYLKPVDVFFPELWQYRPMIILALLLSITTLGNVSATKASAASAQHYRILLGFIFAVCMSLLLTGWVGGAADALWPR